MRGFLFRSAFFLSRTGDYDEISDELLRRAGGVCCSPGPSLSNLNGDWPAAPTPALFSKNRPIVFPKTPFTRVDASR